MHRARQRVEALGEEVCQASCGIPKSNSFANNTVLPLKRSSWNAGNARSPSSQIRIHKLFGEKHTHQVEKGTWMFGQVNK